MTIIPVLDAAQAATWDEAARSAAGIPSRVLMESAGRAAACVLAQEMGEHLGGGLLVVAGHGNNGGDGWVVARALCRSGVTVWAVDEERQRSEDCEANRVLALQEGVVRLGPGEEWPSAGVIVDALLGTGASGEPKGTLGQLARRIADSGRLVAAIDGPTGLDLTIGQAHGPVRADLTVTFGGARRGHLLAREWCGKIAVVEIGFPLPDPAWPVLVHDGWARSVLPPFHSSMHKGDRGRVLVVGGDHGMAGATIHAASTAFAAGAGLVKIAGHEVSISAAQELLPDALTVLSALGPGIEPELGEALDWADAVVLGPGIGRGASRTAFIGAILERLEKPVVIDADALHAGSRILLSGKAARVLTPHPGEFRVAFPEQVAADPFAAAPAAAAAAAGGAAVPPVILLKGVPTVIAQAGQPSRVVAAGNPTLATGGSGDLLAGFIGAFLARGLDPLASAALGAQVLGRAAELASAAGTVRATRPGEVAAAARDLWRLWAEAEVPRPPILIQLEPPALV